MEFLADTAGADIISKTTQSRNMPDADAGLVAAPFVRRAGVAAAQRIQNSVGDNWSIWKKKTEFDMDP